MNDLEKYLWIKSAYKYYKKNYMNKLGMCVAFINCPYTNNHNCKDVFTMGGVGGIILEFNANF